MSKKKWEGHTHTELCQHGQGDRTARMVEKAIEAGFSHYSITEHAPLPNDFFPTETLRREFGLLPRELPDYFDLVKDLKALYENKIHIFCSLEFDYFQGYEEFTKELIASYENELDELLLSVHFLKGKSGLCCLDFSQEQFKVGLIDHYGDADSVHDAYWRAIENLVSETWPTSKPIRIGHLGLIYKYIKTYPLKDGGRYGISYFEHLFRCIKEKGYSLDVNTAGLDLETCGEIYFTTPMWYWGKKENIELVYGSDAHGISKIGRFYDTFEKRLNTNSV